MINLMSTTVIDLPINRLFNFVSTAENVFLWQYGILAGATPPKASGAMQTFFRTFGHLVGRWNLSTFKVTEYEPNERYGFKSLSGPVHSFTSDILDDISGRTRIHIFIQAYAPNFFKITEKLLEKTMKKQLEENISTLKTILERMSTIISRQPGDA